MEIEFKVFVSAQMLIMKQFRSADIINIYQSYYRQAQWYISKFKRNLNNKICNLKEFKVKFAT